MINENKDEIPQPRFGPIQWLKKPLRISIEDVTSKYVNHKWKIKTETDLSEFACHRSAIVSDGSFAVFFKYSEANDANLQFENELYNLDVLSKRAGVLIPRPIDIVRSERGWLLILEALEAIPRETRQWQQIGSTLARIHQVKGDGYGFERDGFWGPLYQDNTPAPGWETFFRDRRFLPLLKIAVESGNLPSQVVSKVESLVSRLPDLCGPEAIPRLLHGDAQQNNFISTANGTYVIDPAIYYGNPEMDLAQIDSFQPVPDDVFDTYRDEMPIDPGFFERRDLWRIPLYLAAVAIEGSPHIQRLTDAIKRYL